MGRVMSLTFERSFIGDIRTTQPCPTCHGYGTVLPDPCMECSGDGRVRATRTINVKIPAGVSTGNRIHLSSIKVRSVLAVVRLGISTSNSRCCRMRFSVATAMILRSWSRFR